MSLLGYMLMMLPTLLIILAFNKYIPDPYDSPEYCLVWPWLICLLIFFLLNKLTEPFKNLDKMNYKILGKAMGYMFMPTLGVLLMLLVGFCDPIAMWTFIKSTCFWAVAIRIILFIAEVVLILVMYDHFMEKEIMANADKYASSKPAGKVDANSEFRTRSCFGSANYNDTVEIYNTEDDSIKVIKLVKKA